MHPHLHNAALAAYRAASTKAVDEGRARPLLVPYSLLGPFIVPVLWLTIPHTKRPWLYQTRWLVLAFVVAFGLDMVEKTSSANVSTAYAAGLMAAWGIIMNMNLLIWKRPQFEALRAVRVPSATPKDQTPNGVAPAAPSLPDSSHVRRRKADNDLAVTHTRARGEAGQEAGQDDFIWQAFPARAPFWERLGWVLDLTCSFRGSGWSHSIASVPRPPMSPRPRPGQRVSLESMPIVSASGHERSRTEGAFVCSRLTKMIVSYLILDLLSLLMKNDPYFILGPDSSYGLPPHLARISPGILRLYRQLLCLAGVLGAIEAMFSLSDLVQYWLSKALWPSRAALCFHSTTFGSFTRVLDRGLAGWWGEWWHQTFRQQFLAPSMYLLRHGYLESGTPWSSAAAIFISFAQSGFLHALGSMSSTPETKAWRAPSFFLLQAVGILVQRGLGALARRYLPKPSRMLTRVANLLFVVLWMHATAGLFMDDLTSAGLWLQEPVPISPLRLMGYGDSAHHWWRWDRHCFPRWHTGRRWWESGIAL